MLCSCSVSMDSKTSCITLDVHYTDSKDRTPTQKLLYASDETDCVEWVESIEKMCALTSIDNRYIVDRNNPLGKG